MRDALHLMRPGRTNHLLPESRRRLVLGLLCFLLFLLTVFLLPGCLLDDEDSLETCPPHWPAPPMPHLASVPETTSVAGHTLVLDCDLWRDFMPTTPPGGKPLLAVVRVCDADSLPIPDGVRPVYLWVVNDDETWSTFFNDEARPPGPFHVERIARCGPRWDTGIEVTVLVKIQAPGQTSHLKAQAVPVEAVW